MPEEWGGDTVFTKIGENGEGIEELLETSF